jgi:hypothetical protein
MSETVNIGDWVHSYSMGIWRVSRVLSGFNDLRYSLDTPKTASLRTLVFSHRLVNTSWKRSFSVECADLSLVSPVSQDERSKIQEMLESVPGLEKAFEKYQAAHGSPDLVVNIGLGGLPDGDRERLRTACAGHLGVSAEMGMTMDQVLVALKAAGYYCCIGKMPNSATVQLVSKGHEVQDCEFVLRYNRVLDF